MFKILFKIPFFNKWFFKLRQKRMYKLDNDTAYIFEGDVVGAFHKGMFFTFNLPEMIKYFKESADKQPPPIDKEDIEVLIKYCEGQEDFEKCQELNNYKKTLKDENNRIQL